MSRLRMSQTSIFLLSSLVFLAACQTVDPYTGETRTSKATTGAVVGAVGGAIVGAASSSSSDRGKGAIIGATAGGLIGGGIGQYMDQQEAELRRELVGSGVQVRREGDQIILVMPGGITFDVNRSEVKASFYGTLNAVAKVLEEYDQTGISIEGHTDSTGSDALNQRLSEARATSVAAYLQGQGISSARIQTAGFGPRYPIAGNDTEEGRALNRRVELTLVPPRTS